MPVSRLREVPGTGVDRVGDEADAAADPSMLRLENLDTDLRPPPAALEATRRAVDDDAANSYSPFLGHAVLREAACAHVARGSGRVRLAPFLPDRRRRIERDSHGAAGAARAGR